MPKPPEIVQEDEDEEEEVPVKAKSSPRPRPKPSRPEVTLVKEEKETEEAEDEVEEKDEDEVEESDPEVSNIPQELNPGGAKPEPHEPSGPGQGEIPYLRSRPSTSRASTSRGAIPHRHDRGLPTSRSPPCTRALGGDRR